jgi:hypothetical protein
MTKHSTFNPVFIPRLREDEHLLRAARALIARCSIRRHVLETPGARRSELGTAALEADVRDYRATAIDLLLFYDLRLFYNEVIRRRNAELNELADLYGARK